MKDVPPRTIRRYKMAWRKRLPKKAGRKIILARLSDQMCTVLFLQRLYDAFWKPTLRTGLSSWSGSDEGTEQSQCGQGSLAHLQVMLEYELCISPSCRLQILQVMYVVVERRA